MSRADVLYEFTDLHMRLSESDSLQMLACTYVILIILEAIDLVWTDCLKLIIASKFAGRKFFVLGTSCCIHCLMRIMSSICMLCASACVMGAIATTPPLIAQ